MKLSRLYLLPALALAAMSVVGCSDKFDNPPMIIPSQIDIPEENLISIYDLKKQYWDDARNYIDTIGLTANDDSLYVNLFVEGSSEINVGGRKVTLSQSTSYPFEGKVALTVTKGGGNFAMKIRIPGWARGQAVPSDLYRFADNLQPGYQVQLEDIEAMVNDGRLPMEYIDRAVKRMLQYIVKTPHFRRYQYSDEPDLKAHAAITRTSATEGMVLLKNEGNVLPLKGVKNVALFGCHSYDFLAGGTGSGNVVKPYVVDMQQGLANAGLVIDEDLRDMYAKYKDFWRAKNRCDRDPEERYYREPPLEELPVSKTCIEVQAQKADVAILTIGRQAGEGGDRTIEGGFNLTPTEQELLANLCAAFHAKGKKVIVVLNVGGAVETASWKGLPDAILLAWQPGQEGGNSVADVLLGKENPSGKLTMTFPIAVMDMPSSLNFPVEGYQGSRGRERKNIDYTLHAEGLNIGYRYFSTVGRLVSYPFGYGLSYTTFAYSKPVVKATKKPIRAAWPVRKACSFMFRRQREGWKSLPLS